MDLLPEGPPGTAMSMTPQTAILTDPDWLCHRYDGNADAIQFVKLSRHERSGAIFLTDDYLPARTPAAVARADAMRLASTRAPIHFILHSAFCCSTLLANAFDRPGLATTFKEPMILNDVVGVRRRGSQPPQVAAALDAALTLLARPFAGDEAAIIKPSNVLNALAPAMLAMRPESKAVLLYAPLEDFLVSVAKKGLDGRLWVRELLIGQRTDGMLQRFGFDDKALFGQTDLQVAAIGWLAQHSLFADLVRALPQRVTTLDSRTLLADPGAALRALARHFELRADDQAIAAMLSGPFRRNAKSGAEFGRQARELEYMAAAGAHADEVTKVAIWAREVARAVGLAEALGGRLV
jgi:hypothetical protein